jgi:tetratricopeptide (TPR) repeat protein
LLPRDATSLGSQLLQGGAFHEAAPYLLAGLQQRPTAFGWCRLGRLCVEIGRAEDAVRCFDEALALEPGNSFAGLDRASALADCSTATLAELVQTYEGLLDWIGPAPAKRVAWAAYNLMQAIVRRRPNAELQAHARLLRDLARHLSQPGTRAAETAERRLEAVLRVRELLGTDPRNLTPGGSPSIASRNLRELEAGET